MIEYCFFRKQEGPQPVGFVNQESKKKNKTKTTEEFNQETKKKAKKIRKIDGIMLGYLKWTVMSRTHKSFVLQYVSLIADVRITQGPPVTALASSGSLHRCTIQHCVAL